MDSRGCAGMVERLGNGYVSGNVSAREQSRRPLPENWWVAVGSRCCRSAWCDGPSASGSHEIAAKTKLMLLLRIRSRLVR